MNHHDQRIRQAHIRDSLRQLQSTATLPVDRFYLAGDIRFEQWAACHLFKAHRQALIDARSKGHVRGPLPADARPRKTQGFSMRSCEIERAVALEKHLSAEYFEWALGLIGEKCIRLEPPIAKRVTTELAIWYAKD